MSPLTLLIPFHCPGRRWVEDEDGRAEQSTVEKKGLDLVKFMIQSLSPLVTRRGLLSWRSGPSAACGDSKALIAQAHQFKDGSLTLTDLPPRCQAAG